MLLFGKGEAQKKNRTHKKMQIKSLFDAVEKDVSFSFYIWISNLSFRFSTLAGRVARLTVVTTIAYRFVDVGICCSKFADQAGL